MTRARAVALLALGCALAAAAAGTGPYLSARPRPQTTLARLLETAARERQRRLLERSTGTRDLTWLELAVEYVFVGAVLLGALVGLFYAGRALWRLARLRLGRSGGGLPTSSYDPGDESAEDATTALRQRVADELAVLSADLDATPDPREAVIACYVRMERAFAAAGSARRPDDSPMELLARVLDELYVPEGDVRRLTALFAEARFSTHPVDDEMRAAARRSLDNVSRALAVPA